MKIAIAPNTARNETDVKVYEVYAFSFVGYEYQTIYTIKVYKDKRKGGIISMQTGTKNSFPLLIDRVKIAGLIREIRYNKNKA
jgi:hypothetical protein